MFSQNITGRVVRDGETPLAAVLVINVATNEKQYTDKEGNFSISASVNDELRFVKAGYERSAVKISALTSAVFANLVPAYHEIEEVEVNKVKLSGDINKDSKLLSKIDKVESLQKEIGIPAPPEKPREAPPPTVKEVGTVGYILSNLNLNTLYKNISGDARRMRNLYNLEDQQSDVSWIRERIGNDYFTKAGVPEKRIAEFVEFSFTQNPKIRKYIHAGNLSGVMLEMEASFSIYLLRLKQ